MDVLIFGRALCGFGGVGLYAGVMTLLSITTTPQERPTYIVGLPLKAFTVCQRRWTWKFQLVSHGI